MGGLEVVVSGKLPTAKIVQKRYKTAKKLRQEIKLLMQFQYKDKTDPEVISEILLKDPMTTENESQFFKDYKSNFVWTPLQVMILQNINHNCLSHWFFFSATGLLCS